MKDFACKKCSNRISVPDDYPDGYIAKCAKCNATYKLNRTAKSAAPPQPPAEKTEPKPAEQNAEPEFIKRSLPLAWLHDAKNGVRLAEEPIRYGDNSIGRKAAEGNSDVPLNVNDGFMSRKHCFIKVRLDRHFKLCFELTDPGSKNGTFVQGKSQWVKVTPEDKIILESGAKFRIGNSEVTLEPNYHVIDVLEAKLEFENSDEEGERTVIIKKKK
ncbi:hypothetical protein BH09BAC2_BH09BAC2_12540 [soil metagenome]